MAMHRFYIPAESAFIVEGATRDSALRKLGRALRGGQLCGEGVWTSGDFEIVDSGIHQLEEEGGLEGNAMQSATTPASSTRSKTRGISSRSTASAPAKPKARTTTRDRAATTSRTSGTGRRRARTGG